MSAAEPSALPFPNSYWVVPGQLLAGEHPSGATREETRQRLSLLLDAGVDCFIDLTMPDEISAYDFELPADVEYIRKPIPDHGLPVHREHMVDILACLDYSLRMRKRTYLHCRAGIGRTGTAVGCLLIARGLDGDAALVELNRLWQGCARSATWPRVPETDEQARYVRTWQRSAPAGAVGAAGAAGHTAKSDQAPAEDPLFDQATLFAARSLRERYLGTLVGLASGDALAAATQYRQPGSFAAVGDLLGGGPFDLPRGAWTDDTAMALCLAESLLDCNGFDPRDQVKRYARWQQEGHLSATGHCVGITASTARALSMAKWRRQIFSGSHDPDQLDPEVLSRVAPSVMFFFASPASAIEFACEAARTTCQAPAALEACRLFAAVLYGALAGKPKAAVLQPSAELIDLTTLRPDVASLVHGTARRSAASAGNTVEVLAAVLWAFRTTDNFRDGALRVANLGANSDAAAAAFGQLAGAHYGVSAVPVTWRNSLMNKDLIDSFADRLLAHALLTLGG
jgi:ADP-ribosyl-[dinitrogen reductase] hydrolase